MSTVSSIESESAEVISQLREQVQKLELRLAQNEANTQQITEVLSGLAKVTQQLMLANNTVVDAAKKLTEQSPR